MVKRHWWPIAIDAPFILLVHFGPLGRADPTTWHLVHEYTADYQWLLAAGSTPGYTITIDQAHLAALAYAANSQVITDFCPQCRYSFWQGYNGPFFPRWNIYHGERGQPIIPCIYWDILDPTPPQGFEYA